MKNYKIYLRFLLVGIVSHVLGYLISGGICYQLFTKELWEAPNSISDSPLLIEI